MHARHESIKYRELEICTIESDLRRAKKKSCNDRQRALTHSVWSTSKTCRILSAHSWHPALIREVTIIDRKSTMKKVGIRNWKKELGISLPQGRIFRDVDADVGI